MAVSDRVKSGPEKAPHRSLWKALGLTDEELKLPLIGVVSAKSECVPGHNHLNNIAQAVKDGIRLAGGVPVEFPAIGVCDGIAMGHVGMKYSLASRELIADSCESMAIAHGFDGMVFIPNCDKIVPGMLMAARRLNLPAMVISGGPMMPGRMPGGSGDMDLNSVFEAVGAYKAGKMDDAQLNAVESAACPGCGSCSGMFTANSMNCITEVIGMALPGNGTIAAVDAARIRLAKKTGMRIVELVREGLTPDKIMTESAFRNALCLDMALGCSTNTVLHLPAIAHEAGIQGDIDENSMYNVLGINALTVWDLAQGHSTIANNGVKNTLHMVSKVLDSNNKDMYNAPSNGTKVFDANDCALVQKAMQGTTTYGTAAGTSSMLGRPVAGKSGTANDEMASSFVGYTPSMMNVWAIWNPDDKGNPQVVPAFSGYGVSSTGYPAHLFQEFMAQALQGTEAEQFPTAKDNGKIGGSDGTWGLGKGQSSGLSNNTNKQSTEDAQKQAEQDAQQKAAEEEAKKQQQAQEFAQQCLANPSYSTECPNYPGTTTGGDGNAGNNTGGDNGNNTGNDNGNSGGTGGNTGTNGVTQ